MSDLSLSKMAFALAAHAGARQVQIARNVANADTPGYRAQDLPDFAGTFDAGPALKTTRPGHIAAPMGGESSLLARGSEPSPNGNDVSLEVEMMAAADIRQQHDMALSIYTKASEILSIALSRR